MRFSKHHGRTAILAAAISLGGCANMMAYLTGPGVTDEDPGKRTMGMVVEDTNIETKVLGNLYKADVRYQSHAVQVESYNGVVLLAGNVPDAGMIQKAGSIAAKMRGVRNVHNELKLGPARTLQTQATDKWIQGMINTYMYSTRDFPASRINTVTDGGVVYMMGLVSDQEANEAVGIIQNISGIKRIVKMFEYIPHRASAGRGSSAPVTGGGTYAPAGRSIYSGDDGAPGVTTPLGDDGPPGVTSPL